MDFYISSNWFDFPDRPEFILNVKFSNSFCFRPYLRTANFESNVCPLIQDVRLILGEGVEKAMNQTNKINTVEHEQTVNREYKTTFILDLRETEDDVAKVSSDIREILSSLGASVSESEDLGIKEFARAADPNFNKHII